jgi:hypothetical protein
MIGVRFLKPTRPWGAGDVTMLPEDVAERVIDAGDGELVDMPDSPHSRAFGERVTVDMVPAVDVDRPRRCRPPKSTYVTKDA